jgi:RNA polymerase-binding transcription factor DksA
MWRPFFVPPMNLEDRAQEHELAEWEARNAGRQQVAAHAPGEPGYGPEKCVECGTDMPDKRREMGSHWCTPCMSARERLAARLRGR